MRKNKVDHNDKYDSEMMENITKEEPREAHLFDVQHLKLHAFADCGTGNIARKRDV